MKNLQEDQEIFELIQQEESRQKNGLILIPSENYASAAVREALGSVLTNKYSEGYPGKRYYSGNKFIDEIENLAKDRASQLFDVPYVNVQPYSGSPANQAVYFALCEVGETVIGMGLTEGGHLTHGHEVNFSGILYKSIKYTVSRETGLIDYDQVRRLALIERPKLIWTGATAYPRIFDWEKFAQIADEVGAYLIADISHIAGLIVAKAHPTPVPYAHVVTTTTHKTLRGPRGAMIMVTSKGLEKDPDLPKKIDRAVFPGLQGGPHDNQVAAIAVCLKEAMGEDFVEYGQQVVKNTKVLASELMKYGFELVSGGTDNHLILINLSNKNITGRQAQDLLESVNIYVNRNTVPGETRSPFDPSGIRLGTPAVTTRGMGEEEMRVIAELIKRSLEGEERVREKVERLCQKFPVE